MTDDSDMVLESIRDPGLPTFTFFYTQNKRVVSPYFNSGEEARQWLSEHVSIQKTNDNA